MKEVNILPPPPPHLLEIYGASTASYAENKCSTYQRYACALFSANSLYLRPLFSKALILSNTGGIRANVEATMPLQLASFAVRQNVASDNPQRIISATDDVSILETVELDFWNRGFQRGLPLVVIFLFLGS